MKWNCPHCGTHLELPDHQVGSQWSFSRCYHCAGYALVRRPEVNLLKVDQVPPGEKVLLPEKAGASTAPRTAATPTRPPQVQHHSVPTRQMSIPPQPSPPHVASVNGRPIPNSPRIHQAIPIAIGATLTLLVASGFYLFQQSEEALVASQPAFETAQPPVVEKQQAPPVIAHRDETVGLQEDYEADTISRSSAAPSRRTIVRQEATVTLHPIQNQVNMRAGPGINYPVIATADRKDGFVVKSFRKGWFKVTPSEEYRSPVQKVGWIRGDYLRSK